MTIDDPQKVDDPFAMPEEAKVPERPANVDSPRRGRYYLPWKDGSKKPWGFQRVSNLVSAFADQFGLRMWELGEVLQGVAADPELYANLLSARLHEMDKDTRNAWVETFIEHAKEASGGNRGSKHGSARHADVEGYHAGLPLGHLSADSRRHLALYRNALVRNQLRALPHMQERRILVESLEVVGTLDNVVEDLRTGLLHIADLKTQRRFWTWMEIAAQFACYAHGDAMWDRERGCWVDMPAVDLNLGFVLWMPRHPDPGTEEAKTWEPRVDVYEVDVAEGWEIAKLAREVVKKRSAGKSKTKPMGWLRAAPDITEEERMVARFAAVENLKEGRALTVEAKRAKLWTPQVQEAAQEAHARIVVPA